VRRGWALGSEEFPKELLARMDVPGGQSHYGPELRESDEEKARRLIAEEIAKRKFPPLNFSEMNKGDKQRETCAASHLRKHPNTTIRTHVSRMAIPRSRASSRKLHDSIKRC